MKKVNSFDSEEKSTKCQDDSDDSMFGIVEHGSFIVTAMGNEFNPGSFGMSTLSMLDYID